MAGNMGVAGLKIFEFRRIQDSRLGPLMNTSRYRHKTRRKYYRHKRHCN